MKTMIIILRKIKFRNVLSFSLNLFVLSLLFFSACGSGPEPPRPRAEKGILDLSSYDFSGQETVGLKGEWEFFWKRFINPETSLKAVAYIEAPGVWNDFIFDDKAIGPDGFASYRLRVLLPESAPGNNFALRLSEFGTAYSLYINGRKAISSGIPGNTRETTVPAYIIRYYSFIPDSAVLDLVLHASNFYHRSGGMWYNPILGNEDAIRYIGQRATFLDLFLFGALFIMGIYHIGLFINRRKDKPALFFGVFCLVFAIRVMVTGEYFITVLFPEINWFAQVRMEFLCLYLSVPLFMIFISLLFARKTRKPAIVIAAVFALFFTVTLAADVSAFTKFMPYFQMFIGLAIIWAVTILIISVFKRKEGAVVSFLGMGAFFALGINDVLHSNLIISTGYYAPFGILIFIFSQSYILSHLFARAFNQVEELTATLERKVEERTYQLNESRKVAETERQKSDKLLLNILPVKVADELKRNGHVQPRFYKSVSILFTDFVAFSLIARTTPPELLVSELDRIFFEFDNICEKYRVEKLKTIGDAYMAAAGIPETREGHPLAICLAALEINNYMNKKTYFQLAGDQQTLSRIRLGIHTGQVMAGVIGKSKFAYDVWGDAVNIAARMESASEPQRINISGETYNCVKDYFLCEYRGEIEVKNCGQLKMFYLNSLRPEYSADENGFIPNELFLKTIFVNADS